MDATLRDRADARLEEALERDGLNDPRGLYRDWLRALRERDAAAFDEARRYYEETLLPRVAEGETHPIESWLDYGRRLAELTGPGEIFEIDNEGRAHARPSSNARERLVLFIPESTREPVRLLNLPTRLAAAQRATIDLLVEGRSAPSGGE